MNMELRMAGLAQARPFQESLPWKQVITNQTRPFRPNRIYADYEAGVVVLVAMKSRSGDDFAVSADALTFFRERVADPASWVQQVSIQLVVGEWDNPASITVVETLPLRDALERVNGSKPISGRGEFGAYYWLRVCDHEDKPM